MRQILIILLFIIPFLGKSQLPIGVLDSRVLINSKFNWKLIDSKISKTIKLEFLNKLYYLKKSNYCDNHSSVHIGDSNEFFIGLHWKNTHIIDIDNDNDFDIIYDGKACPGFEAGQVDILINNNGAFEKILEERGTVIDFNQEKGRIAIHSYPCCADRVNYIKHFYNTSKDSIKFELKTIDLFVGRGKDMGIEILPKKIIAQKEFFLDNDSTELRWSPNYDDYDVLYTCQNKNIISIYPKKSEGYILGTSTNGKWYFVKMKNNIQVNNYCTKDFYKRSKYIKTYGWIEVNKTTYNTIYRK